MLSVCYKISYVVKIGNLVLSKHKEEIFFSEYSNWINNNLIVRD